jgi:hypothetical protein
MIDISYIEDEVEQVEPDGGGEPPESRPDRPRWHRWATFGAIAALLVGLFAFASSHTQTPDQLRTADGVGVGEMYTVMQRYGQSWLRVTEVTLTAATNDGDPAALFIVEGRGWFKNQPAKLTAVACTTGAVSKIGEWSVGGDGSFRFADTDPGGGNYFLSIEGLQVDPVNILIGPAGQRVLSPMERGCPQVA